MIIMDIEASGLSADSYPIEVAWQHRYIESQHDSFLIKPADDWKYWDDYAEQYVHCIPRSVLMERGLSVRDSALRINEALRGQTVYTDAVIHDRQWIKRLFRSAGLDIGFQLHCVYSLVEPAEVEQLKKRQGKAITSHRALADARALISALSYFG